MNLSLHITQDMLFEDLKLKAHDRGLANVGDLDSKESHGLFERFQTCDNSHKLDTSRKMASAGNNSWNSCLTLR
jgi:hypothetical protein